MLSMLIINMFSVSFLSSVLLQCMWFSYSSEVSVVSLPGVSGLVSFVDCT